MSVTYMCTSSPFVSILLESYCNIEALIEEVAGDLVSILLESYCNLEQGQSEGFSIHVSILLESYCNNQIKATVKRLVKRFNSLRVLLQQVAYKPNMLFCFQFQFSQSLIATSLQNHKIWNELFVSILLESYCNPKGSNSDTKSPKFQFSQSLIATKINSQTNIVTEVFQFSQSLIATS